MSSKKDKLIEEAQRFALRGQMDKAIKTYRQVVSLDPSAINQRQRLAELLIKAGSLEDARVEFESIGKYYSANGFYLKAIAVYKKLQMLLPGEISITLTLADLNEKHGLVANALSEYKQVYEHYKNSSNHKDALKILERMHNVDKQNIGIKLMLAESYFQSAKKEDSYRTFAELASVLHDRGDNASCIKLNDRIKQLFPDKPDFMYEVLAKQVEEGNAGNAVSAIQVVLQQNPRDQRFWELIVKAFRRLNEPNRVKMAYQHFLKFFPADISAQKGFLECLISEKDVAGVLAFLDQHEQNFIDSKATADLVNIYKALDLIDPIDNRILKGLENAYRADGDHEGADAVASKLTSLTSFSSPKASEHKQGEADVIIEPFAPEFSFAPEEPKSFSVEDDVTSFADVDFETDFELAKKTMPVEKPEMDEIDIEIEIDDENPFGTLLLDEAVLDENGGNWLDAVGEMFDGIASAPRSVKFGSDVDLSDAQSHYDLGVAFKEMGLFDEAINELRQASDDPTRKVACFILQSACLREKGDVATAESLLRSLLKPGLSLDDSCSVKYDLALTCEAAGKKDEAKVLLAEIDTAKPDFRDVHSRLDAAKCEPDINFSAEDLEGFELK